MVRVDIYDTLCDRWQDWWTLPKIAELANLSQEQLVTILNDLARGHFVRASPFLQQDGSRLWRATAKVGLLPPSP